MKTRRKYMAIACRRGGYTVGEVIFLDVKPIGDCREFESFAEADEAARFIADGKSTFRPAGEYINNR